MYVSLNRESTPESDMQDKTGRHATEREGDMVREKEEGAFPSHIRSRFSILHRMPEQDTATLSLSLPSIPRILHSLTLSRCFVNHASADMT